MGTGGRRGPVGRLRRGRAVERGAARCGGPPAVLLPAVCGYVGHDGHGPSLRRTVGVPRVVGGTRRAGSLEGAPVGPPPVPGLRRRPPG
ncbi:hypothetical protein SGM_1900 [Streptomyces griseoaurantiacus M045]|uniref:Uncharacterized protein n=1 Tax=Streptomyces griseoaurantiacus M045 TaxID=996637 RepID=F3NFK1_9ACTN|nr:hypothetical protein SGM_1900 [Streptomyces griseoaurantiacus M045]